MMDLQPFRSSEPEAYAALVGFTGAGAADPTKTFGKGVTVKWVSTGVYKLTFADPPGNFVMLGAANFQATTMADLKGYDATLGEFDATGKIVQVSITNSTFTLADLQVLQKVGLSLIFKRAGTTI